jgi:tryptophan-rich sensory protein
MIMNGKSLLALTFFLFLCFAAAVIGSLFTSRTVRTWYPALAKPSGTPPAWVFGPVWTTLYALMAISAFLVWRNGAGSATSEAALLLFFLQLILNVIWSGIFFGLRYPGAAFFEIALLWLAILATIIAFWKVMPLAGALLLPYLLWVSYAARLNFGIWQLNKSG